MLGLLVSQSISCMKTQFKQHEDGHARAAHARACAARVGLSWCLPELDTYKQLIQPNNHAGSSPIQGSEMNAFVRLLRHALYGSASMCLHIPAGPLFHVAILRGIGKVDAPLRAYLLRGFYAKSTR